MVAPLTRAPMAPRAPRPAAPPTSRRRVSVAGDIVCGAGRVCARDLLLEPERVSDLAGEAGVALADVDGDGILDVLATSTSAKELDVRLGHGDGSFGPVRVTPLDGGARAVAVADVNGDGWPDVAVATTSSVVVLLGAGGGAFQPAQPGRRIGVRPRNPAVR